MDQGSGKSWLMGRAEAALRQALQAAYWRMRINPDDFLMELRAAHRLPIRSYEGVFSLPPEVLDDVAQQTIRGAMKMAAAEAAGFDLGGAVGIVPDMGVLAVITMRTVQKLSLIYGFEYNTEDEVAELWVAAATAAGADIGKELIERRVLKAFVQRVSSRIATRISAEFAEKFAARALPIASSAVGAVLNWYFVRAWGKRALAHFRQRHFAERERRAAYAAQPRQLPPSSLEQQRQESGTGD